MNRVSAIILLEEHFRKTIRYFSLREISAGGLPSDIHYHKFLPNGDREGLQTAWSEDGTQVYSRYFIDGKQHGLSEDWRGTGILKSRSMWRQGKREGIYEGYDRQGKLRIRQNYRDGKLDGYSEEWLKEDCYGYRPLIKDLWKEGTLMITYKYSRDDGYNYIGEIIHEDDNKVTRRLHRDGVLFG